MENNHVFNPGDLVVNKYFPGVEGVVIEVMDSRFFDAALQEVTIDLYSGVRVSFLSSQLVLINRPINVEIDPFFA